MVQLGQITGLILAGGQGSRLGGIDKGLQTFSGQPLVSNALRRLAPQVGQLMISANRNLDDYRRLNVPVWPDAGPGFEGPLAGILAGLQHCETSHLATVPCDCPHFPGDVVLRLSQALTASNADIAIAALRDGDGIKLEPAFCLMKREVEASLRTYLQTNQRSIARWAAGLRRAEAVFEDDTAFFNINTPDDLSRSA